MNTLRPCPYILLISVSVIPARLAAFSGCASDSDAVEKRLAELRDDIRKLQNDNDRVERAPGSRRVCQAHGRRCRARAQSPTAAKTVERPRLKVLPSDPGRRADRRPIEPAPPDERAPRMILRGQGKDSEIKPGTEISTTRWSARKARRP